MLLMCLYFMMSASTLVLLAFSYARLFCRIFNRVSSESQVILFLWRRTNFGMHWSATEKKRSLKLDHASSIDSVRKQQSHGILLRRSRNWSKKLVPWSLQSRETKRLRDAMKASEVKSNTNSKCTALTEKDTKTQIYTLTTVGLRTNPRSPHQLDRTHHQG